MVRILLGMIIAMGVAGHGDINPQVSASSLLPGLFVGMALVIWGLYSQIIRANNRD